jgi:membrane protein
VGPWREAWRSRLPKLRALAERSAKGFVRHDMAVYAMALAYRGLFALLPFAVFLAAVLSFLRVDAVLVWLAELGSPELSGRFSELIEGFRDGALGQAQGGLLVVGIVLAFWSVSMSARILTKALNAVYEVEETRPAWKRVASSVTFAPALALAVIAAVGLMLVTSRTMAWVSWWVGLDEVFVFLWGLLRIPVALLLLSLVVSAVYRFAPNANPPLRSVMPGAFLAVALWALASVAFAFGLTVFPDYGAVYGSLGGAISLLLYLYVSAAAILFGAEVNVARSVPPPHTSQAPRNTRKG